MLHFVINPIAGNGLGKRIGAQVIKELNENGEAYSVSYTEGIGHATELAKSAAEKGIETVVAVGGDGTVCETARGLLGTNTALGVVSAGTGNDVARMLKIPRKPAEAVQFLRSHPSRSLDAGRINDMIFLNICGTGFDVSVLDYSLRAKKYVRGMLPYLWGVICTIFTYRPVEAILEVDGGEPVPCAVLLLAVANGRYAGGGMDIAPGSSPNDGLLNMVTVTHMPRWKLPFQLPKLLFGKIMQIPGVQQVGCLHVKIHAKNMRLNLDGEIVAVEDAAFSILPGALLAHY